MADLINPYIAGAPVTEQRMFFGRDDIFEWIEKSLAGQYADHILVIHGQRRVGKTSVLKQLGNRLPDKYIPVFFDLQGRTHTSLDRFLWWLAREIVRVLKQERGLTAPAPEKDAFAADPEYFETRFLPGLEPLIGDRSLLLTFDEFDNLEESEVKEELARPLIDYLRRLMGEQGVNFIFSIGSSGRKLENMQAEYTEFFKTALYKKISFLSREQTAGLVARPVEGLLEYEPQAVERIFDITSGHPYFTQLTCHELFSLCQRTGELRIRESDVEAILEDVVERGTVNLKFVWDEASDLEKWSLATLAQLDRTDTRALADFLRKQRVRFSDSDLTSGLLHLREKDVLTPDNRFVIYLLKLWLKKNRTLEQVREELTEVNPIANRYIEIGQEFHDSRLYDKAIENFKQALEISPDNIQAQVHIAQAYMAQGALDQAVTAFEKALEMDDEDVASRAGLCEATLALGDAASEKGKPRDAVQAYQKVLSINAEHTEARQRMAEINRGRAEKALAEGRDEEALSAFAEALRFTPEDEALSARYEQAKVEKRTKVLASLLSKADKEQTARNWEAALEILENALEIAPGEEKVQQRLVVVKSEQRKEALQAILARAGRAESAGRWGLAIAALEEYLALEPGDVKVQLQLEQAQQTLRETKIQETLVRANRAVQARQWEQAIAILEEHLAREPQESKILERLEETRQEQLAALVAEAQARARAFSRQERFEEAITAWGEYLKINPADGPTVQAELERIHKAQGLAANYVEAQKAFTRKNYDRAIGLFKGIVVENADYKDATRLMAEAIELRRTQRKWWQSRWLWGAVVSSVVLGVAWFAFRPGSTLLTPPASLPLEITATAAEPLVPPNPTNTPGPTNTPSPTPTPLPFAWSRLNSGQFLPRDTITAIAVDPTDPGVLYVGTENAGIYKSIDGGLSWQPAHRGLERAWIHTLVIDPQNPHTLYAGVALDGVYKTIDGGGTWQAINNSIRADYWEAVSVVVLDPQDSQHLYYTPAFDLYESTDGGMHWLQIQSSTCPSQIVDLVIHPADSKTLFAGSWASNECESGLYKSEDSGRTWTLIGLKGSQMVTENALQIDSQDGKFLYTRMIPGQVLYTSSDEGQNWIQTDKHCSSLAIDPQNNATVYCGRGNNIERSKDGGQTWQSLSQLKQVSSIRAIWVSPHDQKSLLVGGQGLYVSADGGISWIDRNSGLGGIRLDLILNPWDRTTLYADTKSLYRSSTSGSTWELIPQSEYGRDVVFDADGVTLYRIGNEVQVLRSQNKGESWDILTLPAIAAKDWISDLATHPTKPGTLYVSYDNGIFVSSDSGNTWNVLQSVPGDLAGITLHFEPNQGDVLYAVGNKEVYRSNDAGSSWNTCPLLSSSLGDISGWLTRSGHSSLAFGSQESNQILLATPGNGVVVSDNDCLSWRRSNTGLGSLFVNTVTIDSNNPNTIYAGTDGGAYVSFNHGQSWGQVNDGLLGATVVYSIAVDKENNVYAATPYGIFKLEIK